MTACAWSASRATKDLATLERIMRGAGSCTTSSASLDTIPFVPAARGEALPENAQG